MPSRYGESFAQDALADRYAEILRFAQDDTCSENRKQKDSRGVKCA